MSELLTRKQFLVNAAKFSVATAVGAVGISALSNKSVNAKPQAYTWPWAYTYVDPEVVRIRAHDLYWEGKDCSAGVFGAFLEVLSESLGEPWNLIPVEIMLYGRGGGVSTWGALCGCLNGGAGIIGLVVSKADSTALINELWGWYTTEKMPTDASNTADYGDKRFTDLLPQSISGSVLCHASLTQWCILAKKDKGDIERKERCARLTADIAAKTAEILNAHFASNFSPTFVVPESNASCNSCHGTKVMTTMECVSCHGTDVYPHTTGIIKHDDFDTFKFEQNYPNPFGNSTNLNYALPHSSKIKLEVFDLRGQLVRTLVDSKVYSSGVYSIEWDGRNNFGEMVPGGTYFARLTGENYMKTVVMQCLK